jgi:HK97 family phage major capsid protein
MGATILEGLSSDISFPRQTAGSALTWVVENSGSDVTDSDATFDNVLMSPKILMCATSYSRKLLAQSSIDVEAFVRTDLADAHAQGIDRAAIAGAGTATEPQGILGTDNIGDVACGGSGGVPDFKKIIELETTISTTNGDESVMAYLTTPGIRGLLRGVQQFPDSASGQSVWGVGPRPGWGSLNGYPAAVSSNVPSNLVKGGSGAVCHAIILGFWNALTLGFWGVFEATVDPFTAKKKGQIEVCSYQMVDVAVKNPAQWAAILDAKLS